MAPVGIDLFLRHGLDVLVVWDQDDPTSDVFLRAALSLARALSTRPGDAGGREVDLAEIDDAVFRIGKRAEELEQVSTWAKTIEHNGLKIRSKAEGIKEELEEQLDRLVRQLDGLRSGEPGAPLAPTLSFSAGNILPRRRATGRPGVSPESGPKKRNPMSGGKPDPVEKPPDRRLFEIIWPGGLAAQAVYAAARLNLAEIGVDIGRNDNSAT